MFDYYRQREILQKVWGDDNILLFVRLLSISILGILRIILFSPFLQIFLFSNSSYLYFNNLMCLYFFPDYSLGCKTEHEHWDIS